MEERLEKRKNDKGGQPLENEKNLGKEPIPKNGKDLGKESIPENERDNRKESLLESKKCACKGGNLDRFIQPIILLILQEETDTGYGIFKKVGEFSMFTDAKPDATGVYRYLKIMEERGLLEQFEQREAKNKYKMKYRITEEGKKCLQNWRGTLDRYANAIRELVEQIDEKM